MARAKLTFSETVSSEYRKLLQLCRLSEHNIDLKFIRQVFILICESAQSPSGKIDETTILYSLQLAQAVAEHVGLATKSISAALLYPSVEKKYVLHATVKKNCKDGICVIIDELLKIKDLNSTNIEKDAENLSKLLLTSFSDIRVVLIRIAEMCMLLNDFSETNGETLFRLAKQGMYLYAPIAHRLGLYTLKSEIEDLSFRHLQKDIYLDIEKTLKETAAKRNKMIREFLLPIREQLDDQHFEYEIKSRMKSVYSIYTKMRRQKVDFEEVYDVFAIRIIIDCALQDEKANCWKVFSIVTNLYQPNPERMRDWITVPKPSTRYESLHTTVMDPGGKWTEVQIRTRRMNEIAEKGLAAHWKYKGQGDRQGFDDWLDRMRTLIEKPDKKTVEEIDKLNTERHSDEIFVFTPKGELRRLTKGASVLDFAYEIHSGIGDTCVGGKVNGRVVPIRHMLNNGDRVAIITQKNQKPKSDWLDFAISSKAQVKIRHALNDELIAKAEQGRETFRRRLKNWKVDYSDILVNRVIEHLKIKSSLDFYAAVSNNKINLTDLKNFILNDKPEEKIGRKPLGKVIPALTKGSDNILIIDGDKKGVNYKLSPCCHPIFGDDIFGFVTINDGIKIHRTNCPNAMQMVNHYGYRIINAQWSGYESNSIFKAGIRIKGSDELGVASKITDVISKSHKVNIQSIMLDTSDGIFEGDIKLLIRDSQHLDSLINILQKIKGVESVSRIDSFES
jgi:GTP diphosphokinase / guanosine-3',5'-bis(diphosphate) 3'-diphosphatase